MSDFLEINDEYRETLNNTIQELRIQLEAGTINGFRVLEVLQGIMDGTKVIRVTPIWNPYNHFCNSAGYEA